MSELKRIVGEAIGEASMLRSETPKGVFESTKGVELIERTVKKIEDIRPKPEPVEIDEEKIAEILCDIATDGKCLPPDLTEGARRVLYKQAKAIVARFGTKPADGKMEEEKEYNGGSVTPNKGRYDA